MNRMIFTQKVTQQNRIVIVKGDITEEQMDAIVNAANSMLMHGGGVAGAIVRKGGDVIQEESYKIAPVPVGQAGITTAGILPCNYVIHAVGPRWGEGDESAKLASAVRSSLLLAGKYQCRSISLPAISTGIFGFPTELAAKVILETIKGTLEDSEEITSLEEVRLCLFDNHSVNIFTHAISELFSDG